MIYGLIGSTGDLFNATANLMPGIRLANCPLFVWVVKAKLYARSLIDNIFKS